MPVQPKPKRTEFKTRKEYRFAIKKHKREIQKQPIVFIPAVTMSIVLVLSQNPLAAIIVAIITAILVYNAQKEYNKK
jgi:hypothetical protein